MIFINDIPSFRDPEDYEVTPDDRIEKIEIIGSVAYQDYGHVCGRREQRYLTPTLRALCTLIFLLSFGIISWIKIFRLIYSLPLSYGGKNNGESLYQPLHE